VILCTAMLLTKLLSLILTFRSNFLRTELWLR